MHRELQYDGKSLVYQLKHTIRFYKHHLDKGHQPSHLFGYIYKVIYIN